MSETLPSKKHNWIAVAATLLVLGLISLFAWRVVYFAKRIQAGDITRSDLSFLSQYSASRTAASLPLPEGEFDVATTDDPAIGGADAKAVVVEFADFSCPFSRAESFIVRSLAQSFGDQVRFVYRDYPIDELHPEAELAAEAGECAQEQGKFWEYHDKLYLNQADQSFNRLVQYAQELNLNTHAFRQCLTSGRYKLEVADDYAAGLAAGVHGTPTFFVNGNRIPGAIPEDIFRSLIERLLKS